MRIDALAITNHKYFDKAQYQTIVKELGSVKFFPDIEVSLGDGLILIVGDVNDADGIRFVHSWY